MTLEEEYENQQSWRTSHDKLTFIICAPIATSSATLVTAGDVDANDKMRGDINFFLYPSDDADEGSGLYTGEVDVMVASAEHRGCGLGRAAVQALLVYVWKHEREILSEFVPDEKNARLEGLMVKIKEGNGGSRALFGKLGFVQSGEVNYFGEVKMVLPDVENGHKDRYLEELPWWDSAVSDYEEVQYKKR